MSSEPELVDDNNRTSLPANMDQNLTLLVIGKTGNGKSSLCNIIAGQREQFPTGRSMSSTTVRAQRTIVPRDGFSVKIVDTPDVFNMDWSETRKQAEVDMWKSLCGDNGDPAPPPAVIIVIRCDVRYTKEEYDVYRDFLHRWGNPDFVKQRLMVGFSFGDRQDRDIAEELKEVNDELKQVVHDARGRYVVFSKMASDEEKAMKVYELLKTVEMMKREPPKSLVPFSKMGKIVLGAMTVCAIGLAASVTGKKTFPAVIFGIALFVTGGVIIYKKLFSRG